MVPRAAVLPLGRRLPCLLAGAVLAAGCRLLPGPAGGDSLRASLIAAVRARLSAESQGFEAGDPAEAASLSKGQAATVDRFAAAGIHGQRAGGDTSDYGFDILGISVYPLDGGTRAFVGFIKGRTNDTGDVFSQVELYQRGRGRGPWKALETASLAANLDPPALQLDAHGDGHLLSARQMRAMKADPAAIAQRYAAFATAGEGSGKPEPGDFQTGPFTTGEVRSEAGLLESITGNGTADLGWAAGTGGEAVALRSGALVFAHVTQTTEEQRGRSGPTQSFFVQDGQRMNWGGLLAPGDYSSLRIVDSATLVVAVPRQGLPDVIAESDVVTSCTGIPLAG